MFEKPSPWLIPDFLKLPKPIKEGIPMEVKGLGGLFFVGVVV